MSWSTRDNIKRKFRQASNLMENAQEHLFECFEVYKSNEERYQKYVKATDNCMKLIEIAKQEIDSIHNKL